MADLEYQLTIITPERVMYRHPVERIIFQSTEGELAVLKGHIPLTAIIASSVFHITLAGEGDARELTMAVHEGFVEIQPDAVTILTESAEWPEEIDVARAEEARDRARNRLKEPYEGLDIKRAEYALKRSLIRLEAARR